MIQYALNRLFWLIPTLLAMSAIVFFIAHTTPGSPLDPSVQGRNALSPEAMANLRAKYNLDKPLWWQYGSFLTNAMRGDFGTSFTYKTRTVNEILAQTFPTSLKLGTMAIILATVVGITLGTLAAIKQNTWIDYLSAGISVLGTALPNFVIAVLLIFLFALVLKWLPASGWDFEKPKTLILPTVVLALFPIATLTRYTRASMIEVLRSDYVRTARAKGLSERKIITAHVMKNALVPVVTVIGPLFAAIGTGTFVVEQIFAINGMGKFFVTSMLSSDYPMIMAVILLYGVFLAIMNVIVDLFYGVLDPRIRLGG